MRGQKTGDRRQEIGDRIAAFSLIEIMITVGLLSFIILGLMLMFNQVQKAFRSSMTQTDYSESGRSITDMMARELEEMTPAQLIAGTTGNTNFFAVISAEPLLQYLPGMTPPTGLGPWRTNYIQDFFFMSKNNLDYIGTGYHVVLDGPGLGTLYRYSAKTNKSWANSLSVNFINSINRSPVTNVNRIADGIVHLQLRAFDTNGAPITPNSPAGNGLRNTYRDWEGPVYVTSYAEDQVRYYFFSNAVPAYVELEVGFLETHHVDRYRAIAAANGPAALRYLSNHVANVHLFRQRVPIRNVDFSAYQ